MKTTLVLTVIAALLVSPVQALQANASDRSDWSRVLELAAGTKVIVTAASTRHPARYVVAVDEAEMTVLDVDPSLPYDDLEHLVERFARKDISEIRAYPGRAGTFMGDVGGLFAIGGALVGIVGGGILGHRQFAHDKGLGAILGAAGGYVVGLAAGFAIMAIGGAFREDVIYRAPVGPSFSSGDPDRQRARPERPT